MNSSSWNKESSLKIINKWESKGMRRCCSCAVFELCSLANDMNVMDSWISDAYITVLSSCITLENWLRLEPTLFCSLVNSAINTVTIYYFQYHNRIYCLNQNIWCPSYQLLISIQTPLLSWYGCFIYLIIFSVFVDF